MLNLYQILGVERNAREDEIKRAYYLRAKECHPDSGESADTRKFCEITEAYQILSDISRRAAYDATLKTGKIERGLFGSEPETEFVAASRPTHGQDDEFRSKEMRSYRRQMLVQAFLRVGIITFIGGLFGSTLALLLNIPRLPGVCFGFIFALVWSINRHFDLKSFIRSGPHYFLALWGGRAVMLLSIGYFVILFLIQLFVITKP